MNEVVFKASAALSPTRGIHSGNCGFSRFQQKGGKKIATLTKPGFTHNTISHPLPSGKTCPCTWRDEVLKPTRQTGDNREVKGPIGSGHGHMTRPQAIPKRLPALVFSGARWPACRGLLMRSCREKKSRHCSGAEESIGYLSKGALSGI